jgi:molybdenum cofactor cytidylyltransferase
MAPAVTAALVLAAGASARLGQPKALVPVAGEPALASCAPVVVVTGAHHDQLAPLVMPPARIVQNEAWRDGRTGSLQRGLQALPPDDVIVWPVDHPVVASGTLRRLLSAQAPIRVPVHAGRRGHPTYFAAELRPELLALAQDEPLRAVVHRQPRRVEEVPVDDPGILLNLDTPDDVSQLP